MATMRPFSSYTLEGNWFEDRSKAPLLKGGIADYGFREYESSARTDFASPTHRKEYRAPTKRSTLRYGMVTPDTLTEAAFAYGEGAPPIMRFDAATTSIARAPTESEEVKFPTTTTMREAMAKPVAISEKAAAAAMRDENALLHTAFAPPAGGAGTLRMDRGKKSLGITGEVLRIGEDPKTSTDAQRSWIQRRDPGINAFRNPTQAVQDASYMSLPLSGAAEDTVRRAAPGAPHGRFAAFSAAPRVVTDVTASGADLARRPGVRVFADE